VTTAKRPSYERGMAGVLQMFLSAGQTKYFFEEIWTPQINLNSLGKSSFT
jgi:hypothetical protein